MSGPEAFDVVIVGAGVTGLRAAARLAGADRSVLVLEARDRVGGRLLSVPADPADPAGGALDLGATWFWPGEPRVGRLAGDLGLRLHQQHVAGDAAYQDARGAQRLSGNPVDVPAYRFSDGAATLAAGVHAALPDGVVRCGEPVTALALDGDGVVLDHPGGPTRARAVVLALPPSLAVARIAFDPPLPPQLAATAAATPVWMGAVTKVVVAYGRPWWRDAGLSGSGVSRVGPIGELHDISGPDGLPAALFGFVPPDGRAATVAPEAVLAQLASIFGPVARTATSVHVQDWRREVWTSPPDVEELADRAFPGPVPFRRPAHGRIWLASTETASFVPGHIEGALAAADFVADALLSPA